MRLVLVNPPPPRFRESYDAPGYPHLGLGYLGAFLKAQGIAPHIIDAKYEKIPLKQVAQRLANLQPQVVGITAMTHEIGPAHQVAQLAKSLPTPATTIIGGVHATALPEQTLQEFPSFDFLVFGEGENTLVELLGCLEGGGPLESIPGIAHRSHNGIKANAPRPVIADLDSLPSPAWELFPNRGHTLVMMTTRGCPFQCNFCLRASGTRVRKRSPENVADELERDVRERNASYIILSDETFAVDRKYAHRMLDLMLERGLQRHIRWECNTRVDIADYELFVKMKTAGCDWVGLGVESGNPEILKRTRKGITLEEARRAVEQARRAGLKTGTYFILGHPLETRETALDTINFAAKLNSTTVAFGIMVPYPGTEVYEMARRGEGGYKIISANWADFNKTIGNSLELEGLSRRELERLQLWGYFKFYLSNRRFLDFLKLFLRQWRVVGAVLGKILRVRS